jgi:hypothetical protein
VYDPNTAPPVRLNLYYKLLNIHILCQRLSLAFEQNDSLICNFSAIQIQVTQVFHTGNMLSTIIRYIQEPFQIKMLQR